MAVCFSVQILSFLTELNLRKNGSHFNPEVYSTCFSYSGPSNIE